MNEIYWITVLGSLRTAALIIFAMATGVTILCVCILLSTMSAYDDDEQMIEDFQKAMEE